MTNQIAIWLGLFLIGAALVDWALTGGVLATATARLLHDVILTLRFW